MTHLLVPLLWSPPALAEPPIEEICVTTARTAQDVRVDEPPRQVTAYRAQIVDPVDGQPPPTVTLPELLRAGSLPMRARKGAYPGDFDFQVGAVQDPTRPGRAVLGVRAVAPEAGLAPLRLTFVLDTSPSMRAVFMRELPALQDEPADGTYRPVTRLELSKAALRELLDRLPDRAVVAVVGVDRGRAELLLPPTPIEQAPRIHRAVLQAGPVRTNQAKALDTIEKVTIEGGDPCADTRILFLTDENARLQTELDEAQKRVKRWFAEGASLWTMSMGVLDSDTTDAAALTARGGGLHTRADTVTDAVRQLVQSLRVSGVVGKQLSVSVARQPEQVARVRRVDGGPASWTRAEVRAAEELEATYVLERAAASSSGSDAVSGPAVTVEWKVVSPYPGEWAVAETFEVAIVPAAKAPPWLRDRLVAVLVGEALVSGTPDWRALADLADELAAPVGMGREIAAWADYRAPARPSAEEGGLPFLRPTPSEEGPR